MLTRRKLVLGAALAALVPVAPALAAPDPLLADILYGVSDALIRDYIYRNYEYGRWDGRYWWYRGNRYTPATYRRFWIDDYYRHYPSPPPAHRPPPPGHRPPPPPHFDGPGGRPPPPLRPPHFAGGRPPGGRARGLRSLHTVRARTRRISAVPATGRRMQAVRGPVTRTAAVRVRLTSEVRAAEARAVPAVPADAAAPQPVPHLPSGCGPEPHPRTPDGLDSGSRIRIDKRSVANYHSRHGGVKWQAGHPQWLPKPPPQTGDGSI